MTLERKFIASDSGRREWAVVGHWDGLSFWACPTPASSPWARDEPYYGGVESHYNEASRPEYLDDQAKHDDCLINGGNCWHDGTSLWAAEHWIPRILPGGDETIYRELERYYERKMRPEVADVARSEP